ncbi:MAG: FG-GAP-like repeat-containing protein, partial [Saprospiraceae bacterium]
FPDITELLNYLPEKRTLNYLFINNQKLGFVNMASEAGMTQADFSNGSALADLDGDGDLDLIVNNLESPAYIYRNDVTGEHWLQIEAREKKENTFGIGTSVDVFTQGMHQHGIINTNKGFLSGSEPLLQFGLGEFLSVDSIILLWPEGSKEIMLNVKADQRIIWHPGSGIPYKEHPITKPAPLFEKSNPFPVWTHQENIFVDFKRERLLPYMISADGPCMSVGDVNGDKLDDVYVGNGSGFSKALFVQNQKSNFILSDNPAFIKDSTYEDCGSVLKDFDGDGDLDLVVVSGGSSFNLNDVHYMTRFYINDGKGVFTRSPDFPIIRTNAGAVIAFDFDQDGDDDLIIAGRSTPGRYPESPRSYLLRNDKGKFKDITHDVFPELENIGMITDMETGDLDGDHHAEIVFVGDWLPISIFSYDGKKFVNKTASFGLDKSTGWWKCISLADMDDDGDLDIIAGNTGLNTRLVTNEQNPITLITKDFDGNGSLDPIMAFYFKGQLYPFAERDDIIGQIPALKKKFNRYGIYSTATIGDIFTKSELSGSTSLTLNTLETVYLVNENKKFIAHVLPVQAQLSPVYDMIIEDFDHNGKKDILMAGNFNYAETETGEEDAGTGTLLLQNTDGSFSYIPNMEHGFWAQGEVRELKEIQMANGNKAILTGNNQGPLEYHIIRKVK